MAEWETPPGSPWATSGYTSGGLDVAAEVQRSALRIDQERETHVMRVRAFIRSLLESIGDCFYEVADRF